MDLSIEHIHKDKKNHYETLLLLLLPAIVFFLTIAIFAFNHEFKNEKLTQGNEVSNVLGNEHVIDNSY